MQNTNHKIQITNNGFTLLEVMMAIFIIIVGITGTFTMLPRMLSATSDASSRLTAAYLAQEGIEVVRNIRDTNWLKNRTTPTDWDAGIGQGEWEIDYTSQSLTQQYIGDGNYLDIDAFTGLYGYSDGSSLTEFKRKITISKTPPNEIKIVCHVEWQDGYFTVEDHIFNWK